MSRNRTESLLTWTSYSVSRREKEPLLRFIVDAIEMRGCRVVQASDPSFAPFRIVYETPAGERHGVLAYAFFANAKLIKNRPLDEHRFQIKYGSDLKTSLQVAIDPTGVVTTIPHDDRFPRSQHRQRVDETRQATGQRHRSVLSVTLRRPVQRARRR